MQSRPQKQTREQSAQQQYPRKIGYVARRLDDLKAVPATKPDTKQKPRVITDWASI